MRKLLAGAALVALVATIGCKKTGEGEYEVERPVVGTTTDTINTPTVGTEQRQVTVPDVDVNRDTATVRVPVVNPPNERR